MVATSGTVDFNDGDVYKTILLDIQPGAFLALNTTFTATLESARYMGVGGR